MKNRIRPLLSLLCTAVMVLSVAAALVTFFRRTGDGNMAVRGTMCFRYFTVDSNLLAALLSLATVPAAARSLRTGKRYRLSRAAAAARGVGAAAVGLTFAVVVAFLGPVFGYGSMFVGHNLFLHLLDPLLAMAAFVWLDRSEPLGRGFALLGALPAAVFACFYLPLVVIWKIWPDFYGFNMGGLWYVSAPVVLLAAWGIAALLRRGHNAAARRETESK